MDIDVYDEDHFKLNRSFDLAEVRGFLSSHFIPEIEKIDGYLTKVGSGSLISLTSEDTGTENETLVDQADALAIRAFLKFLTAWFRVQAAYDWDFNAGKGDDLTEEDFVTLGNNSRTQSEAAFRERCQFTLSSKGRIEGGGLALQTGFAIASSPIDARAPPEPRCGRLGR